VLHAFDVADWAKENFEKIANSTSGRCERLDINSSAGSEMLTNLVTEEVLRDIGGMEQGDTLVEEYRKTFKVTSHSK